MRLLITTPAELVVDVDDVRHVRAEDETGAFGILPGHADFLTVLEVSVITWRDAHGGLHHVAVRGGLLTVRGGTVVEIATREAIGEESLAALGDAVLERFRAESAAESAARVSTAQLHMATMRQIERFLESGQRPVPIGTPRILEPGSARKHASDTMDSGA